MLHDNIMHAFQYPRTRNNTDIYTSIIDGSRRRVNGGIQLDIKCNSHVVL